MPEGAMAQRVSLITLGVTDLDRALAFYRALGWRPHEQSVDGVVAFFALDGFVLALWGRSELAEDSGVDDLGGWGGVTLAHNVTSPGSSTRSWMRRGRREPGSAGAPGRPRGAATRASSSIPTGIRGRRRITRDGTSTLPDGCSSAESIVRRVSLDANARPHVGGPTYT